MSTENNAFKLLLVDDNLTNLSLLAQIVEMDLPHVRVFTAQSAAEGLELAAQHEMDGAFVDVQMPGVSGLDLCRQFKEDTRFCHIPVVLMTAHIATAELRAEGLEAGAYDFISQPISNIEMLARIKVMLRLRQSEKLLLNTNQQLRQQVVSKTSALRWLSGLLLSGGEEVAEEDRELAAKLEERIPEDRLITVENLSRNLFREMPLRWRRTVMKLSLLETIPRALAERLAEIDDIEGALEYLWRHNFFVEQSPHDKGCYRFHDGLKDRFRVQVEETLSVQEQEDVYALAADWHCQQGQLLTALTYLLEGKLYAEIELFLSQHGTVLMAEKFLPRLAELMERVPDEIAVKRSWLALFVGITMFQRQPREVESWLELARTLFLSKGEARGELLTLSQQVMQYLLVDGLFSQGRELLPRIRELLNRHEMDLEPLSQAHGHYALAIGAAFFEGDIENAELEARQGLVFAAKADSGDLQFGLRLLCGSLAIQKGRFQRALDELELCHALLPRNGGGGPKYYLRNILICDLMIREGNIFTFREQYLQLERSMGRAFLHQSSLSTVLCQYRVESFLALGQWDAARDCIELCGRDNLTVYNPHLRSLVLQYRALLWYGDVKKGDAARFDLQESMRLRKETGGLRYTLINLIIAAVCVMGEDDFPRAERLLRQAMELSETHGEMLIRTALYARQADLLLRQEREEDAVVPLRQLLETLDRLGHRTFYLATPDLLRRLLPLAVRYQLFPAVVRALATQHLDSHLREDGSFLPMLEIKTLGPSGLYRAGKQILECSELGSVARQMIDLLVVAPNHRLGLEYLLGLLWPESSTNRARASFDTTLSRLRKTFDAVLERDSSRDYLVLEKGVLSLQNTIADCQLFADAVNKAQQHLRRQEHWQAGLAFREADRFWNGGFLAGHDLIDELVKEQQRLTELRLDMLEAWGVLLMKEGNGKEMDQLVQEGIRLDPTREQLVRMSYRYHLGRNEPVQARKILEDYRRALLTDDYTPEDAREIIQSLQRESGVVSGQDE